MSSARFAWGRGAIELVIIVIGVLVALAVDEWWGEREDRVIEAEYLSRIRDDIRADIENFRELELIFETKAEFISDLMHGSMEEDLSMLPALFAEGLIDSTYVALPDSQSTTFDELLSTGRLALIESIEKRARLSQYYSGFEHISEILFSPVGEYRRLAHEALPPEIFDRNLTTDRDLRDIEIANQLEELVSRPEFGPAANAEVIYANNLLYYLRLYRSQAEELLELMDAGG